MRLLHAGHGDGDRRACCGPTRNPSEQDIARVMDRNVCRCGTYPRIVKAVKLAAEARATEREARMTPATTRSARSGR